MDLGLIREIELTIAKEAKAHADAVSALNPYSEAESLSLGSAEAVYSGATSPIHGVFAFALDGPIEERDWQEVERFFLRKERSPAFWCSPASDPSLLAFLRSGFVETKKVPVHGFRFGAQEISELGLPEKLGSSTPNLEEWALTFSKRERPGAKEPNLFALTKMHQREIRFYLSGHSASYTFFQDGIAFVPHVGDSALLALQIDEAKQFKSASFAVLGNSSLPFLYERTLYEPV